MIEAALEWGFWLVLSAITGGAIWLVRSGRNVLGWGWGVTLVAASALLVPTFALDIGYVAPLSIMQDIVAAEQALQGRPLPTTLRPDVIKATLEKQPYSFSLGSLWPQLLKEEREDYSLVSTSITEQAHPPFMTLFIIPFVYFLGVRGTFLAMFVVSIVMLALSLTLLDRGLKPQLELHQKIVIVFLLLGWCPTYWVLRGGQLGALLCGPITIGWYCIRQHRPVWAGIAVGFAASIKLIPVALLVYFLVRHRRALVSAVVTVLALNLFAAMAFGTESYKDYLDTVHVLFDRAGGALMNWSILGALHRVAGVIGLSFSSAIYEYVFLVLSLAILGILCTTVRGKGATDFDVTRFDLEYSLFVVAMVLLSPICWFHYFVMLILPLAVLAGSALRQKAGLWAIRGFLILFIVLAMPPDFTDRFLSMIQFPSWRLGQLLRLLPSAALLGMTIWLRELVRALPALPDAGAVWEARA